MASSTPAAPTGAETSEHEAEAAALAERSELEFRARHSLTIDAQASTILEPHLAREMRAVPLGIEDGRPVVAVADPSEKRLAAIRKRVGGETKFVLVAPESLDALLKSRIFNEEAEAHDAPPAEAHEAQQPEHHGDGGGDQESQPVAEHQAAVASIPAEIVDAANVNQLADQLARAAETLLALQSQVQGIAQQFDQTRQELREQKERLAAAAAKADQDRARIRSVAASLAEDVARLDRTKADLAERLEGLVQDE